MDKSQLTYILFNFGYITIFGILTAVVTLLNMPKKDAVLKSYRKSRYALGCATGLMAVYCTLRIVMPIHFGDYIDFWLLSTFTLIFSWLSYASFLFLIETPRYRMKNFIADGVIPASCMLIAGGVGILENSSSNFDTEDNDGSFRLYLRNKMCMDALYLSQGI